MSKKLDPDIKAMRALKRTLDGLPSDAARKRVTEWFVAYYLNVSWFPLETRRREWPGG